MEKNNVIKLTNKQDAPTIQIDEKDIVLFFQGEKIQLDSFLLAGETIEGERLIISDGNSLDQSIILKEELSFAINKEMEKRYSQELKK